MLLYSLTLNLLLKLGRHCQGMHCVYQCPHKDRKTQLSMCEYDCTLLVLWIRNMSVAQIHKAHKMESFFFFFLQDQEFNQNLTHTHTNSLVQHKVMHGAKFIESESRLGALPSPVRHSLFSYWIYFSLFPVCFLFSFISLFASLFACLIHTCQA